ncbi:MAG: PQQ-dependent sugar dehydrogenase [Arenicella sp.]
MYKFNLLKNIDSSQFVSSCCACMLMMFSPVSFAIDDIRDNGEYKLKKVVSGFGIPWGMSFLSEDLLIITEKRGRLSLVDLTLGQPNSVEQIKGLPPIMQVGQGGLLDVKVEPSSLVNDDLPMLYFSYVANSSLAGKSRLPTLKLARAQLKGLDLINLQVLFEANYPQKGGRHFGSRIAFDGKGYVYFSMGDRGERNNAQKLSRHSGSIFRLHLDGTVPVDNPFVGLRNAMPEIWSYGHRNPQGLMFDQVSQRLWSIEHGPRGGDEINLVEMGRNYGWPVISYGREYASNFKVSKTAVKEGMEQPVYYYTPSIAPSSLLVHSGKRFPEWRGALLSGALKLRHLNVVKVDQESQFKSEQRFFEEESQRIRNVVESPQGAIYLSTDSGNVFQVVR